MIMRAAMQDSEGHIAEGREAVAGAKEFGNKRMRGSRLG